MISVCSVTISYSLLFATYSFILFLQSYINLLTKRKRNEITHSVSSIYIL